MDFGDNLKKLMGLDTHEMSKLESTVKQRVGYKLKQYSEDASKIEPTGDWQGRQDAARHLLALGDLARKTNPTFAKVLGNLHEYLFDLGASTEDTAMDVHNNNLAAMTLFNAKDYNEIKDRVKKLMEDVQYKDTSDATKPVVNTLE